MVGRKIIGARYYSKHFEHMFGEINSLQESKSARDMDGHGTHIASIATGRTIKEASSYGGLAFGTASGGAPMARLAIYKVCWATPNQPKVYGSSCLETDVLSAIEDAIGDGVHVLSISLGQDEPTLYDNDGTAVGAFYAIKNNIVVVCPAGNSGPELGSVVNVAPWIITVGASSIGRTFPRPLLLENSMEIMGQSVTPYQLGNMHPLIFSGDAENQGISDEDKGQCLPGSLSPDMVKGKIVLCTTELGQPVVKGAEVQRAGEVGMVLGNMEDKGDEIEVHTYLLPTIELAYSKMNKLLYYLRSIENLKATIGPALIELHNQPTPSVLSTSGRGPNMMIDPHIIKPDIIAPGLNILAAWSEKSSPTNILEDRCSVKYNIETGTSIAVPHVTAVVALLKVVHPDWSFAAIKSALMTTAVRRNNDGLLITESNGDTATSLEFGSGHFMPTKAANPGLVYDSTYTDYLIYLCSGGLQDLDSIGYFDPTFICPANSIPLYNLNYPSIAIPNLRTVITVQRTVTNVGNPSSVYLFSVEAPTRASVTPYPPILIFNHVGQKIIFTITVIPTEIAKEEYRNQYMFGWYSWRSNEHDVTSPTIVSF